MDLIHSIFFFFLTRIFVVKLVCLALVISCYCFLSDSETYLGVAVHTCLLNLKLNHRLQILGYDWTTSASTHKIWLDFYISSCCQTLIIRCWIKSKNLRCILLVVNLEVLVGVILQLTPGLSAMHIKHWFQETGFAGNRCTML